MGWGGGDVGGGVWLELESDLDDIERRNAEAAYEAGDAAGDDDLDFRALLMREVNNWGW